MKRLFVYLAFIFLISPISIFGQWSSVGSGFTGGKPFPNTTTSKSVQGMIVFQNDLYVWGDFDSVDGIPASNFARYDGSNWHSLPFTGYARDMAIFQGVLIIAGYTGNTGPLPNRYITKWDGANWTVLDTIPINASSDPGENGPFDIEVYKNELYLGGRSFNIGGSSGFPWSGIYNHIGLAKWNGNSWDSIPNAYLLNGSRYYFSHYNDSLIIINHFSLPVPNIDTAYWFFYDGANLHAVNQGWQGAGNGVQLGDKFFRAPQQVGLDSGQITFPFSSNIPSGQIIKHNNLVISIKQNFDIQVTDYNLNYTILDSGILKPTGGWWQTPFFESLCVYNDTLYAGGNFDTVNGIPMNRIMKWEGRIDSTILSSVKQYPLVSNSINIFPNPVDQHLSLQSSNEFRLVELKDLTGTTLFRKKVNSKEFILNTSGISNGLYLISIVSQTGIRQTHKVIIQH
ncbi:MAG: T9SS type A sorting domain-containing protein [Cytophagales bacterium]